MRAVVGTGGRARSRLGLLALVAVLAAVSALALPSGASAAKFNLTVHKVGTGTVKCEVAGSGTIGTCASSYVEGTELVLYATPGTGYVFLGWTDEHCESYEAEPCELVLEEATTVTAKFGLPPKYPLTVEIVGTGTGTVKCEVVGSGSAGPCAAEYLEGTELNLYATPGAGSSFVEWTDAYCSFYGAEPCEGLLFEEEEITVAAEFSLIPKYPLTVAMEGTGTGTVKCEVVGSGSAGPCAAEYPEGTKLELFAFANPGSEFTEWSGECDVAVANKCEFEMTEARTVTAVFTARPLVSLTVHLAGTGEGKTECKVNGGSLEACKAKYSEGTGLALVAVAKAGSTFAGFSSGAGSATACTTSPCTFTITGDSEVTATFKLKPTPEFGLTIAKAGTGSGSVTCNGGPCQASYSEGVEVTLAASPAAGSTFAGWSGGGCSGTGPCKLTIKAATTVTATFSLNPTPNPEPQGTASAARSAKVNGRKAALRLTCSGGPCKGTLKLTAKIKQGKKRAKRMVIGSASFSLASGASRTLAVKISAAARTQLVKDRTLKAALSGTGITASAIKLKLG